MPSTSAMVWSDAELVRGMLLHDSRAWRFFLHHYERFIFAAIDRILRQFPSLHIATEREEIYASLLSSLVARDMQKLRAFDIDRGNRLSTWMTLLAKNATWDYLRAVARAPQVPQTAARTDSDADHRSPLSALLTREQCTRIASELAKMTERDRQFVELFFLQSQEPEEVAAAMSISVKTVYTKRHKLKCRLEQALRR